MWYVRVTGASGYQELKEFTTRKKAVQYKLKVENSNRGCSQKDTAVVFEG